VAISLLALVSSSRACEAISLLALVSSSRVQRGDLPVGIGFVIASAAWRSPCGLGGRLLLSLALHRNDELYVIASAAWRSPCGHWFRHRERSVAISLLA